MRRYPGLPGLISRIWAQPILPAMAVFIVSASLLCHNLGARYLWQDEAVPAVFGQTAAGIHMGLMVVNLFSTVLLYLIARPMLGAAGAALAAAAFIITSADTSVLGLFGHATHSGAQPISSTVPSLCVFVSSD